MTAGVYTINISENRNRTVGSEVGHYGVRRRDREGDIPQGRSAHPVCSRGQPPAIVIGQAHALGTQPAAEALVFFDR